MGIFILEGALDRLRCWSVLEVTSLVGVMTTWKVFSKNIYHTEDIYRSSRDGMIVENDGNDSKWPPLWFLPHSPLNKPIGIECRIKDGVSHMIENKWYIQPLWSPLLFITLHRKPGNIHNWKHLWWLIQRFFKDIWALLYYKSFKMLFKTT